MHNISLLTLHFSLNNVFQQTISFWFSNHKIKIKSLNLFKQILMLQCRKERSILIGISK